MNNTEHRRQMTDDRTQNTGQRAKIIAIGLCLMLFASSLLIIFEKNTFAQTGLKAKVPDLCYNCHTALKESLRHKFVHFPFKQGKCQSCHDLHASDNKGMIKEKINAVCIDCHKSVGDLMKKGKVHGAIKNGICTDCHKAHSGEFKNLLIMTEDKLCFKCHENIMGQMKKPHSHTPFAKADCSSCHNAHASTESNMFVASPNKVCKSCHAPRCKAGGVSISAITTNMDCVSCHTGHNSDVKGLLGPYGHPAFLKKACTECHNPIGSDKRITTKMEGEKLCFSCHPKEKIQFKDGDVHGSFSKNPCTLCHNYHASTKNNFTVEESDVCLTCHDSIEKKTSFMIKKLKGIKKTIVKDRKCFECHKPMHSMQQYSLVADKIQTCSRCHAEQHRISHPMGQGVLDVRSGRDMDCMSCHSMHDAGAEFMLTHDRRRALCIQCHKI